MTDDKKRRTKRFAASFGLSLMVLAVPLAVALIYLSPKSSAQQYDMQPSFDPITLLTFVEGEDKKPLISILVRIEPDLNEIALCTLPGEMLVEDGGAFVTLSSSFGKNGPVRACESVENALAVTVDRYANVTSDEFVNVVDTLGAFDCTLDKPLLQPDGTTALAPGRQVLDGRKLLLLISDPDYYDGERDREESAAKLLCQWLIERLPVSDRTVAEEVFKLLANSGDNNLRIADYESRKNASLGHAKVTRVAVYGGYSSQNGGYILSAQAMSDISAAFGQKA